MDVVEQMKLFNVARKLLMGHTENVASVTYEPQKIPYPDIKEGVWHFPCCTPEEQGIPSAYLERFYRDMAEERSADPHGILIVRNGYVIASGAYAPYRNDLWHISHSMCKSVTGLAIGMLVSEGRLELEEKLTDIFPSRKGWFNPSARKNSITVRHLLTMSSGVTFAEPGVVTEDDFVKAFMESGRAFEPGEKFSYNSMNTLMLSAIVQKKTGQTLMEYLTPRLWEPLGIKNVYWETSATGITKGGWGLNIGIEDMAKLGQLYLNGGIWEGRQIVPREWLLESSQKQIDSDPAMSPYGYGYQVWQGKMPGAYHFNGMLGQNVFIIPRYQMVVAITAGSSEIFGTGKLTELIYQYFESPEFQPSDEPLPSNPSGFRRLTMTLEGLRFHEACQEPQVRVKGGWYRRSPALAGAKTRTCPVPRHFRGSRSQRDVIGIRAQGEKALSALSGNVYQMEKNAAGMMPLFIQLMHNNYAPGISQLGLDFRKEESVLRLTVVCGEETQELLVGMPGRGQDPFRFGTSVENQCVFREESYAVGISGAYDWAEDGGLVVKLQLCFLETSNTRYIRLHFTGDEIEADFEEYPTLISLIDHLAPMMAGGKEPLNGPMRFLGELEVTRSALDRVLTPAVTGTCKEADTQE